MCSINRLVILLIACVCIASTIADGSASQKTRDVAGTISLTIHEASNAWWLALAVSDAATSKVELKDAGAYGSWADVAATNWGYWTFQTTGNSLTPPISVRLTSSQGEVVTLSDVITAITPGAVINTAASYSSGASPAPTPSPPTTPATSGSGSSTTSDSGSSTTSGSGSTSGTVPSSSTTTGAPAPPPVTPSPAPTTSGNPFVGADFYVIPSFASEVQSTVAQYPADASLLQKAANLPVAFWIDRMAKIPEITAALDGAKAQQATTGKPTLTAFVIYDLPNRDCAAGASNGEISCAGDASCAQGLSTYQHNYIDPIVNIMKQYPNQPIVAIVEPDSLPNLATNIGMPNCAAAQTAYKQGIAYAVQQLSTMSNVHIYIDAAHGGWLGWPANLQSIASIFNEVLVMAGGANKVRGFVTNVSGYQALGSTTSTEDPCNLASQYNFAINEVKYVDLLSQALATVGITDKGFIIDTSRNGVPNTRTSCSNWCNINNAGLGMRPSASTSMTGLNIIDAFYWVKVPGESDGTSDASAQRYDATCSSADSAVPAPQAGQWFPSFFLMLCKNANPAL